MRFQKQQGNQMPQVNLVPMMDVLMTVLTFFIIVSMTLTGQIVPNLILPDAKNSGTQEKPEAPKTLVVVLNTQKQTVVDSKPLAIEQLTQQVQEFLTSNPEGVVVLKADRGLTYADVTQVLKNLRDMGGSRVSLAISGG